MSVTIDDLQIEVQASSSNAAENIDGPASSLMKLKSAAKSGIGLTSTINQLNGLNETLSNMYSSSNNAPTINFNNNSSQPLNVGNQKYDPKTNTLSIDVEDKITQSVRTGMRAGRYNNALKAAQMYTTKRG